HGLDAPNRCPFSDRVCGRRPLCLAQDQCRAGSGFRGGQQPRRLELQTPQQLVLAIVRLSSEPTPLFRLRSFGRWHGGFLLSRSGSFGLWLLLRKLLSLRRYLLRFCLWLFAFRLLFLLRFFLGDVLCVHPLNKRHTRRIALPRAEFDDSGVTAVSLGGTLRDLVEQFFDYVFLSQYSECPATSVNRAALPERYHPF